MFQLINASVTRVAEKYASNIYIIGSPKKHCLVLSAERWKYKVQRPRAQNTPVCFQCYITLHYRWLQEAFLNRDKGLGLTLNFHILLMLAAIKPSSALWMNEYFEATTTSTLSACKVSLMY